jgi:hypothetical protein
MTKCEGLGFWPGTSGQLTSADTGARQLSDPNQYREKREIEASCHDLLNAPKSTNDPVLPGTQFLLSPRVATGCIPAAPCMESGKNI